MSTPIDEFSRFAHQYNQYNIIQTEVAQTLISEFSRKYYRYIVDIGCGNGAVYRNIQKQNISYDTFMVLDSSKEMLSLHPDGINIKKIHADFNRPEAYKNFYLKKEETVLFSASALQWSRDLDFVFSHLASLANDAYFAIFTSGTFRTLHLLAGIESPIYTQEQLQKSIGRYYKATFTLKSYKLAFKTVQDMFRYIKKSGVSGGKKQLSYTQTKRVMQMYPLDYLEFEVLYVKATSLVGEQEKADA